DFPLKEFVAQRVSAFLETIMCNASQKIAKGGQLVTACAGLNADGPWGPPMEEIEVKGADGKPSVEIRPMAEQCTTGQVAPLLPKRVRESYGKSSLYSKMQEYLGKPLAQFGPLGPRDFAHDQNEDFLRAYFTLIPYYTFADPAVNQFVRPVSDGGEFAPAEQYEALGREVAFHKLTGQLDRG